MNHDSEDHADLLLPVLVYIQAHLHEDLSLERVARLAGLSPHHFHRIFKERIGETLKQYTQRLRLERAAFGLGIWDISILELAHAVGFGSHETFTRAFSRRFGQPPQAYGQQRRKLHIGGSSEQLQSKTQPPGKYQLSRVTVRKMRPIPVAFIRHLGPYATVDASAFDQLVTWAKRKGCWTGQNLLVGVGHDDQSVTAPDKVRFDACLEVPGPFAPEHPIGYQVLPGGYHATVTYVGPYGPSLEAAYRELFVTAASLGDYELVGLPAVEIYRTTQINPDYALNETDIYIPVRPR